MAAGELFRTPLGHWLIDGDVGVSRRVGQCGTFEYHENLKDLARASVWIPEGGVVVDAGACVGDQTCTYSQMVGPHGLVYAFEPHPVAFRALVKNTERLMNVRPIQAALGSRPFDDHVLSLTPNVGASFVGSSPDFPHVAIEIMALDKMVPVVRRLDFIHLDAEGMESRILMGAETLLKKFQPVLMIEICEGWLQRYGSSSKALMQQLASYGYFTLLQWAPNPAQFDVLAIPVHQVPEIQAKMALVEVS